MRSYSRTSVVLCRDIGNLHLADTLIKGIIAFICRFKRLFVLLWQFCDRSIYFCLFGREFLGILEVCLRIGGLQIIHVGGQNRVVVIFIEFLDR